MNIGTKVDTADFNRMCREIARRASVPYEEVLKHEVGKVLEQTIKNTKTSTVASIRASSDKSDFTMQPAGLYSPKSPRAGVKITKGGFIAYYLKNRYPDTLWGRITARRKISLQTKLKARGLARKSWLDIANKLGLSISFPGYVASAVASDGKDHGENTSVAVRKEKGRVQIEFHNSQPTVNKIGGGAALQAAISGRYKYFLTLLEKKTFDDIAKIALKYPGMKIG